MAVSIKNKICCRQYTSLLLLLLLDDDVTINSAFVARMLSSIRSDISGASGLSVIFGILVLRTLIQLLLLLLFVSADDVLLVLMGELGADDLLCSIMSCCCLTEADFCLFVVGVVVVGVARLLDPAKKFRNY